MNIDSDGNENTLGFPRTQINVILLIGALFWFISPLFVIFAYSRCDKTKLGIVLVITYLIIGLVSFFVLNFWPTIAVAYIAIWVHINILGSRDPTAVTPASSTSGKGFAKLLVGVAVLLTAFLLLAIVYYFFGAPPPA